MIHPLQIYRAGRIFRKSKFLANFFFKLNKIINACYIPPECNLGKNIQLIHGGTGVFISATAVFGENVKIYQHVTIGNDGKDGIPVIGDNVTIYAHSMVMGNIHVGNNSIIGAMSLVNKDVPPFTIWAGNPAKQIGVVEE